MEKSKKYWWGGFEGPRYVVIGGKDQLIIRFQQSWLGKLVSLGGLIKGHIRASLEKEMRENRDWQHIIEKYAAVGKDQGLSADEVPGR